MAAVTAQTLRYPQKYNGQTIPLGYDAKTMDEIAQILTEVVEQPFHTKAHSPEEFLEQGLQSGVDTIYQNAYTKCVYNQLKLNIAGKIPEADATFDNFEAIAGRKPNTWKDFISKHKEAFVY